MIPLSARLSAARFLDPALLLLIAVGVGLWLSRRPRALGPPPRRAHLGRILAWAAWASLWVLSMPVVAGSLYASLEMRGPPLAAALRGADPTHTALVVLGGGVRTYDSEMPLRERLDGSGAFRILGAARLYAAHDFGLIVLTGAPRVMGEAMADLITTLGVPRERLVLEGASLNTRQNAENCAPILRARGITHVVVVTSAVHLRRGILEFERAGISAIPAAVDIVGPNEPMLDGFFPSAAALARSHQALHELLGLLKP